MGQTPGGPTAALGGGHREGVEPSASPVQGGPGDVLLLHRARRLEQSECLPVLGKRQGAFQGWKQDTGSSQSCPSTGRRGPEGCPRGMECGVWAWTGTERRADSGRKVLAGGRQRNPAFPTEVREGCFAQPGREQGPVLRCEVGQSSPPLPRQTHTHTCSSWCVYSGPCSRPQRHIAGCTFLAFLQKGNKMHLKWQADIGITFDYRKAS